MCCRGANSTYNIRIGRSAAITGPYLDKSGKDLATGGGTLFLETNGSLIGPGHAGIITESGTNWFSCHIESDGGRAGALCTGQLDWGADGWPFLLPVK
jgi:arabinan endo-1,5-alpha-L-arabinosidase